MLEAYFDESGTHSGSKVLSVAGYIAEKDQWLKFIDEWASALQKAGLPPNRPFHAVDFESRRGDFENWPRDARMVDFHRELLGIVRRRVRQGFSIALDMNAWDELVVHPVRAAGIGPAGGAHSAYSFALAHCLVQIEKWADEFDVSDQIAYFLESGAGFGGDIDSIHRTLKDEKSRYRFQSLTVVEKHTFIPLQAADVLAYESYKHWLNFEFSGKTRPERLSFEKLMDIPTAGGFFDKPTLGNLVAGVVARG